MSSKSGKDFGGIISKFDVDGKKQGGNASISKIDAQFTHVREKTVKNKHVLVETNGNNLSKKLLFKIKKIRQSKTVAAIYVATKILTISVKI